MGAECGVGYDARWHEEINDKVNDHDERLRGNGKKGLMERVSVIETYISAQIERDKEKRTDRLQYKVAVIAALLALIGLLIIGILDHTAWKPVPPPVVVQQTTTTDSSITTTKTQKAERP